MVNKETQIPVKAVRIGTIICWSKRPQTNT